MWSRSDLIGQLFDSRQVQDRAGVWQSPNEGQNHGEEVAEEIDEAKDLDGHAEDRMNPSQEDEQDTTKKENATSELRFLEEESYRLFEANEPYDTR